MTPQAANHALRNRRRYWPTARQFHVYSGLFIAPSVLLLAVSGGVQLVGLHEPRGGYRPPAAVAALSRLHIHQRLTPGQIEIDANRRAFSAQRSPPPAGSARPTSASPNLAAIALKVYFGIVTIGLCAATLVGLWIALRRPANRGGYIVVMLAGAAIPLILAALT